MIEQMEFPITFEEFAKEYGFNDHRHIYTNGSDLIPIFRVKQWIEHDNKLRKIETDTAYECGKHANRWISVSERLPKDHENVLIYLSSNQITIGLYNSHRLPFMDKPIGWGADAPHGWSSDDVVAWMPLPEPFKAESEVEKYDT